MQCEYPSFLAKLVACDPILGDRVSKLRNLEGILQWAPSAGVDLRGVDLVQQDEYCYDLYLPLPDSRWLIFGVT